MSADPVWMVDNPDVIHPDGGVLLTATMNFIRRFCIFPDAHSLVAVTLWVVHSHMVEHFYISPRLALLSQEAASGKTRAFEVVVMLVPEPMFCLSASPAAVFRTLADRQITLMFDEVDTIFQRHGKDDGNEDLRALLNAGYKRGATIPRCVGPRHEVQRFPVFSATALAGLGDLPDTVMSRSIIIRMKRRAPHEYVEPFRSREHEALGFALRDKLAEWAQIVGHDVGASWPAMPDGVVDRPAEVWEPLIAIADAAGGVWPQRARDACVALCKVACDRRVTLGVRLLADLRIIFGDADALSTRTILERLCEGDQYGLDVDAPWPDLRGRALDERGLARMLKKYDVHPVKVKIAGSAVQGYRREHMWDPWERYLPPVPNAPEPAEPTEPSLTGDTWPPGLPEVPEVPEVPDAGSVETELRVACRGCAQFDPDAALCRTHGRPVDPDYRRQCPDFGVPF